MRLIQTMALTILLLTFASIGIAQSIQINRENKTIAISTSDEAVATADLAAVSIGFNIYDADAESVTATAGKLSHTIIEVLHKAGIDGKSIESKGQHLSRNTNFDDKEKIEQRARRQFQFEQSWEISTSPQNAASVIRLAIAAGANASGDIEWRLADRKALQAQAAANALIKARAVATQMADGLHVKLGNLIYASNESPNTKLYFRGSATVGVMADVSAQNISNLPIPAPLEIRPQTIREEATVYAVFAID